MVLLFGGDKLKIDTQKFSVEYKKPFTSTCFMFSDVGPDDTVSLDYISTIFRIDEIPDTSDVTDMYGMFSNCRLLTHINLSSLNTSNVTNMGNMFLFCSGLTSLDVSSFDTSKVIHMSGMFSECNSLKSLDLSNFDTSKVTDMAFMFKNCSGLTSLNLSNFNTSQIIYMNHMFYGCNSLKSLDLSNFDTSNVNDMSQMFRDCSSLTYINLSGCDIRKAKVDDIFHGCVNLETIDLSGAKLDKNNLPQNLFLNNDKLKKIKMCGCDTEVIDRIIELLSWNIMLKPYEIVDDCLNHKFAGEFDSTISTDWWWFPNGQKETISNNPFSIIYNKNLTNLSNCLRESKIKTISKFPDTSKVTNIEFMFNNCKSLVNFDANFLNTSKVTNISWVFGGCSNLQTLKINNWNTSQATNMECLFLLCESLVSIDLSNWDTSQVKTMRFMFQRCYKLREINLSGWDLSNIQNVSSTNEFGTQHMFAECPELKVINICGCNKITIDRIIDELKKENMLQQVILKTCEDANRFMGNFDASALETDLYWKPNATKEPLPGKFFDIKYNKPLFDLSECLHNSKIKEILIFPDTTLVNNMFRAFSSCNNLTYINVSNFNTSKVTTMGWMFTLCSSLTSLNLSNFDTSNVINMAYMFSSCSSLTSLNLSNFNTSKVTSMISMFNGCSSLTSLNLSNFKASQLTNMHGMFFNCTSLKTIRMCGCDSKTVDIITKALKSSLIENVNIITTC